MKKSIYLVLLIVTCSTFSQEQTLIHETGNTLTDRWQIKQDTAKLFKIISYKPVYFLLANYTTDINNSPTSSNPLNIVDEPTQFNNSELKFQLSFKTKVKRNLFGKKIGGDIWVAYTQSSRWQLYSAHISRPFRETNYEPEAMIVFPTPYKLLGMKGVYTGIGINHQSNGTSNPYSRSWNRVILQFAWERPSWSFVLRPWWRIQETPIEDNNPDIEDYIGRMELLSAYSKGKQSLSVLLKHSLRGGNESRGSINFIYGFKLKDYLQIYTQVFHGYGESLIDYNHKQTTFGIGLSLIQWR